MLTPKGIKTDICLNLTADAPIQDIDLIGPFSNLLDNEIERCIALDEDKRFIRVADRSNTNTYVVKVVNSKSVTSVIQADGKLLTNKNDSTMHGLGIDIVLEIAKKYDALAHFHDLSKSFEAVVLLNLAHCSKV